MDYDIHTLFNFWNTPNDLPGFFQKLSLFHIFAISFFNVSNKKTFQKNK